MMKIKLNTFYAQRCVCACVLDLHFTFCPIEICKRMLCSHEEKYLLVIKHPKASWVLKKTLMNRKLATLNNDLIDTWVQLE